jgi:hypothetical protein
MTAVEGRTAASRAKPAALSPLCEVRMRGEVYGAAIRRNWAMHALVHDLSQTSNDA